LAAALGFGAWLASPAVVQALPIIDEFDEPAAGQTVTPLVNPFVGSSSTSTATGLVDVLGGSRDLTLTAQAVFAGGSQANAEINLITSPGNFQLTNSIRVDSVVEIAWDANDAGLDTDFSAFTGLALQGVENDLSTSYTLTLATFGGGSASLTLAPGAEFSGNLDFSFASFIGSLNLADVDSIVLEVDGARGADVIIDRLVAVPEPTTAAALAVGLAGLAWMGRRRPSAARA
jgi:hypothetical protein